MSATTSDAPFYCPCHHAGHQAFSQVQICRRGMREDAREASRAAASHLMTEAPAERPTGGCGAKR